MRIIPINNPLQLAQPSSPFTIRELIEVIFTFLAPTDQRLLASLNTQLQQFYFGDIHYAQAKKLLSDIFRKRSVPDCASDLVITMQQSTCLPFLWLCKNDIFTYPVRQNVEFSRLFLWLLAEQMNPHARPKLCTLVGDFIMDAFAVSQKSFFNIAFFCEMFLCHRLLFLAVFLLLVSACIYMQFFASICAQNETLKNNTGIANSTVSKKDGHCFDQTEYDILFPTMIIVTLIFSPILLLSFFRQCTGSLEPVSNKMRFFRNRDTVSDIVKFKELVEPVLQKNKFRATVV